MSQVLFTNEEVDEKYPLNIGIGSQPVISGKATINNKLQGKLAHLLIKSSFIGSTSRSN